MSSRLLLVVAVASAAWACNAAPGRPAAGSTVIAPDKVVDFAVLYAANCAGCHGVNGRGGAAIGLADPVYLAIADDTTIRRVTTNGVPGTAMPPFAQRAGGLLTDEQIDAIVGGIRARWAQPAAHSAADVPPHAAAAPGNPTRGAEVYARDCSACHGTDGRGGERAGAIVDGAYLALVSDQSLTTTLIVGRPDLGAPHWRGNVRGTPPSAADVADVVAWLAAQRPPMSRTASASLVVGGPQ